MVEGPKVILKAERLRSCVLNQTLLSCELSSSSSSGSTKIPVHACIKGKCVDVVSVGKELFLVFEQSCHVIRIHFQMNGTEILLPPAVQPPRTVRGSRKVASAIIRFQDHDIHFFDTSISLKSTESFNIVCSRLSRDISVENFDVATSVELLEGDCRPVQEAVMDQSILPGVGNIIKCEGLFRSRVNPSALTRNIPKEKLSLIVTMLYKFAREWLHSCRSRGRRAHLEFEVYGRDNCSVCRGSIRLERNRGDGRITYYCPSCQPNDEQLLDISKLSTSSTKPIFANDIVNGAYDIFVMPKCKCISSEKSPTLQRVRKPGTCCCSDTQL